MTVEGVLNFKGIEDRRQVIGFELNIGDNNRLDVINGIAYERAVWKLSGENREQKGAGCSIQDEKKGCSKGRCGKSRQHM